MFSSKKNTASTSTMDTLIGKDSTVDGKVKCNASLRIEGKVNGDVECSGDVTLGKEAIVYSTITARNVINSGTIHGAIRTNGTFTIASTGKMYGDIAVGSLSIASGGIFEGSSKMIEAESNTAEINSASSANSPSNSSKPKLHKIDGSNHSASKTSAANSANSKSSAK